MSELTLQEAVKQAQHIGRYFVTITTYDNRKVANELSHYHYRQNFPKDDIVSSIDTTLRSLDINPPQPKKVVKPVITEKKLRPLKIAILTHLKRCSDSYSPGKAIKNQVKLLQRFGHEVVLFVMEGSSLEVGCQMKPVMPRFKREKHIVNNEFKEKFVKMLQKELVGFDVAITHDLYLDDCITYREGIKECGINIPWLHWARSGVGHSINFKMPNARYIYMNYHDAGHFAKMIGADQSQIRVVFNEKDPSLLWNWDSITRMIVERMRLWEKDIIQIYPICSTRLSAKGLHGVIKVFGALKRSGKQVALIICNSNANKRKEELDNMVEFAANWGLTKDDFVFTSSLSGGEFNLLGEVPNKVVVELMQISNLFIFPTRAEVCSNVLLEASMTQNLIIINDDLPSLKDFMDKEVMISYPFTSLQSIHFTGQDNNSLNELAKVIISELYANRNDRQFRHTWRTHNIYTIYEKQLKPILYERHRS